MMALSLIVIGLYDIHIKPGMANHAYLYEIICIVLVSASAVYGLVSMAIRTHVNTHEKKDKETLSDGPVK